MTVLLKLAQLAPILASSNRSSLPIALDLLLVSFLPPYSLTSL
jgi:hypothetical protein